MSASSTLNVLLVVGARPNFMKVAPLIRAIDVHNGRLGVGSMELPSWTPPSSSGEASAPGRRDPTSHLPCPIAYKLVHTGQHYDARMSDVFFAELGIPAPDVNLEVGSGSHASQTAIIMTRFEPVLERERPDWLVVVGDVNSTMACTLVASKLGVKVAHVEAGLRSFDRSMPEEVNRLVTDVLADLLLTPSEDADENLRREGVPDRKIKRVGNIMIDSLVASLPKARSSNVLSEIGLEQDRFAYVTLHRPSNVDNAETLCRIMAELHDLARTVPVVFAVHPRTRRRLEEFALDANRQQSLRVLDPIGYHDSLCLTEHARLVITDSGGLQEECTYFRTPCLTLRPNTERPITVSLGSNRLTTLDRFRSEASELLQNARRVGRIPPLWDGRTAERILGHLQPT